MLADGTFYVKVQGTVGGVEKAFNVQIDNYDLNGTTYRSNKADPSANGSAGGLIAAVTGLDDFGFRPTVVRPMAPDGTPIAQRPLSVGSDGLFFESQCFRAPETQTFTGGGNTATYTGNRFGADITNTSFGHLAPCGYQPSELQTAYNMTPLYQAGWDGTGQTIVITDAFGDPTIASDAEVFSQVYGLPDLTPSNFQVLRAPGAVNNPGVPHFGGSAGWRDEITLDVEWVHAMAPGANRYWSSDQTTLMTLTRPSTTRLYIIWATPFPIAGRAWKALEIPLGLSATTAFCNRLPSKGLT